MLFALLRHKPRTWQAKQNLALEQRERNAVTRTHHSPPCMFRMELAGGPLFGTQGGRGACGTLQTAPAKSSHFAPDDPGTIPAHTGGGPRVRPPAAAPPTRPADDCDRPGCDSPSVAAAPRCTQAATRDDSTLTRLSITQQRAPRWPCWHAAGMRRSRWQPGDAAANKAAIPRRSRPHSDKGRLVAGGEPATDDDLQISIQDLISGAIGRTGFRAARACSICDIVAVGRRERHPWPRRLAPARHEAHAGPGNVAPHSLSATASSALRNVLEQTQPENRWRSSAFGRTVWTLRSQVPRFLLGLPRCS